jgi:Mrp family chromosome partitioning ATPase
MQRAVPETERLGLSNLLTGSANLSDIWHADAAVNGLTIVASGSNVKNPAGLLAGEAMQRFLAMAKEQFDLVVVDSPAVMAGADAWLLSQIADETLFFVRWARTPRPVSAAGLQQLVAAGGKIAGAVLTFVDLKRISEYSATDGISYSKELRRYYPGVAV